MADRFTAQKQAYARLIINAGVNLRKGQGVYIQAELGHRDFVRLLTKEAYAAGAKMVMADWRDPLMDRERYLSVADEYLEYLPDFVEIRAREMIDDDWVRIALTGDGPGVRVIRTGRTSRITSAISSATSRRSPATATSPRTKPLSEGSGVSRAGRSW